MNEPSDRDGSSASDARDGADPRDKPRDKVRDPGESRDKGEGRGDARGEGRDEGEPRDERDRSFRRLGDSLISSIWGDSSAAIKRGQGLVTGVAHGTKEELVRMISAEVRGFLDKMDAADLVQEIVSGLVIEMKTEIRFRRSEDGKLEPDVRTSETKVGHDTPDAPVKPKGEGRGRGQSKSDDD